MRQTVRIVGARVVTPDGEVSADVRLDGDRIEAIGASLGRRWGETEVDARGLYMFPGGVDPHVHFNEPGRTDWEGFETGSRAALAGGVSTVADMPLNSHPPTVTARAFEDKRQRAGRHALVGYGLWGGIVGANPDDWQAVWDRGAVGFKLFLTDSGIAEFPPVSESVLAEALAWSARSGALLAVHAEDDAVIAEGATRLLAAGRRDAAAFLEAHRVEAEWQAVDRVLARQAEIGGRVHFVHISTPEAVTRIARARQDGQDVTVETCPHYLVFDRDDFLAEGARLKCAPPFRGQDAVEGLWAQLARGDIDYVASDHSPSPPAMKERGDVWSAWGGISGVQSTLSLLLTEGYAKRGLALAAIARLVATNAAGRLHMADRGAIAPGLRADFTLVDLNRPWQMTAEGMFDRHRHNPYRGRTFQGRVVETWVGGRPAFRFPETFWAGAANWVPGPGLAFGGHTS